MSKWSLVLIYHCASKSYILKQQWCLFVCGDKQGRGRAARADTRPLFSVTNRVGQGSQGSQGRHPLAVFSYRQGRARAGAGQGGQGRHPPVVFSYACISRLLSSSNTTRIVSRYGLYIKANMVVSICVDKNWAVLGRFFQSLLIPCGAGDKQGKVARAATAGGHARCHFY